MPFPEVFWYFNQPVRLYSLETGKPLSDAELKNTVMYKGTQLTLIVPMWDLLPERIRSITLKRLLGLRLWDLLLGFQRLSRRKLTPAQRVELGAIGVVRSATIGDALVNQAVTGFRRKRAGTW